MVSRFVSSARAALVAALLVSAGLNIVLASRAVRQRAVIDELRAGRQQLVGRRIGPIPVVDLEGRQSGLEFTYGSRSTVVYVFEPGCGWCVRNREAIAALAGQAGESYRFVGLSLSDQGLGQYLADNPMPFEVYGGLDRETISSYELGGTPRTLVIGADGTVLRNWTGAYTGDVRSEIEAYFGISIGDGSKG